MDNDDFIVGEPLYENSNVDHPSPYTLSGENVAHGQPSLSSPYYNGVNVQSNNYVNPYYQVPNSENYFGTWAHQ